MSHARRWRHYLRWLWLDLFTAFMAACGLLAIGYLVTAWLAEVAGRAGLVAVVMHRVAG